MKRLVKIFLASLLLILLAIIGLVVYIKVKYPSERLKEILIARLAEDYGIRATIARLNVNLFSGFELENITILGAIKDDTMAPALSKPLLTAQRINFAYRWRSLFARKLDIDEISIDRPSFSYWQAPNGSSNLDAILTAFVDSTAAPSDTAAASLPLSIHLKTFNLRELQIKAAIASAVDTQDIAFGPISLEVSPIEVDRSANLRGQLRLHTNPASVSYVTMPVEKGEPIEFTGTLQSNFTGTVRGDSVEVRAALALDRSKMNFGQSTISLPQMSASVEVHFNLASSQLVVPDFRFTLHGKEQLAARFAMEPQDSTYKFACHVDRGVLDLDQFNRILESYTRAGIFAGLKNLNFGGSLEFSGSEIRGDQNGMQYAFFMRGRDLIYEDFSTGLKIDKAQLQLDWQPTADSTTGATVLSGKLNFTAFDVPIDTQAVLKTGSGNLEINLLLSKDFLPRQGFLNLNWQNFSEGNLSGRVTIRPAGHSSSKSSWLSSLRGEGEILADSVELSPLSAGMVKGKISGKMSLKGKRLDELNLTCDFHNALLSYDDGIEYKGKIPPYHLFATANMKLNSALTRLTFANGILQCEPATARFTAVYDIAKEAFRFDITEAALDLSHAVKVLPDTIFAGLGPLRIEGMAPAEGWFSGKFLSPDSLDYNGFFKVQSDNATYHDSTLGIYADSVKIDSQWSLTTAMTTGEYSVFCPAPRLPDYLPMPLPPTIASGKIAANERTFTIKDGKFAIPEWKVAGSYKVDGDFLAEGMEVKTKVDLGLHASEPIVLNPGVALKGNVDIQLQYDQYLPNDIAAPQPVSMGGWLQATGLHLTVDTLLALRDLNAYCDFAQDLIFVGENFSLQPATAASSSPLATAGEALLMYDIFGGVMRNDVKRNDVKRKDLSKPSRLTIAQVDVLGYQITDVVADLALGNCRFDIPQLRMNLFGGNMVGNLLVGLGDGNPDGISYSMMLQISSIDVSGFRKLGAQVEKGSKLSADFYLSGLGASPEELEEVINNLTGRLNITKIENKVASNLLQTLDPNGTDAGIQRIRLLLKTGWNVQQMTFEMKSGFVYASLTPVKPWFAPFTLPPTLDFARLPIRYFMETAVAE